MKIVKIGNQFNEESILLYSAEDWVYTDLLKSGSKMVKYLNLKNR
jgi:hypothetical protein